MNLCEFDVETLEPRNMLAGNINAVLTSGGDLVITGDNVGNGLKITYDPLDNGHILRSADGTDTLINGGFAASFSPGEVIGDVRIDLKDGDNQLLIGEYTDDVPFPNDLTIRTGNGNDTILVSADADDVRVSTAGGDDSFQFIGHPTAGNVSNITGNVKVNTGSGNDFLRTSYLLVDGNVSVNTARGSDRVVSLYNTIDGHFKLSLGSGDDELDLVAGNFGTVMSVRAGGGADSIFTTGSINNTPATMQSILIHGGAGTDILDVHSFSFDELKVRSIEEDTSGLD